MMKGTRKFRLFLNSLFVSLTINEKKAVRYTFNLLDVDESGVATLRELLKSENSKHLRAMDIINVLDLDTRAISWNEFYYACKNFKKNGGDLLVLLFDPILQQRNHEHHFDAEEEELILDIFDYVDADRNGIIEQKEIKSRLGLKRSEHNAKEIGILEQTLSSGDTNADGLLDLQEWLTVFVRIKIHCTDFIPRKQCGPVTAVPDIDDHTKETENHKAGNGEERKEESTFKKFLKSLFQPLTAEEKLKDIDDHTKETENHKVFDSASLRKNSLAKPSLLHDGFAAGNGEERKEESTFKKFLKSLFQPLTAEEKLKVAKVFLLMDAHNNGQLSHMEWEPIKRLLKRFYQTSGLEGQVSKAKFFQAARQYKNLNEDLVNLMDSCLTANHSRG
eukprot:CAMPEP_0184503460 /NCGR_PEP_ID=MMETSP0113_2-20130426/51903_1 /TAXON_ID=91329 /ORGANISM="Norrisiella sphaerica, Strain BC52" /LENGTH=389 /DNA_ID=CAMNT_0026892957 /DNA_START=553 /DNA_END=1722 /DNA_ORIENTATION=+